MSSLKTNSILLSLLWTALLSVLLFLNIGEMRKTPIQHAEVQAKAAVNAAISFRSWGAHFGGVYVKPSEKYPPNPYLKSLERDVTTTTGTKLTLINPAYMMRQVFQDFYGEDSINGHMTSLKLLNPNNKPDEWERESLLAFERGAKSTNMVESTPNGGQRFRYMQALFVEQNCLKCHGEQNYKVGDIRGGISTYIDLSKGEAIVAGTIRYLILTYLAVWFIGLTGIFFAYRRSVLLETERKQKTNLLNVSEHLAHEYISSKSGSSNLEEALQAISAMLEKRDPYTAGHQQRVADLAEKIALELGLSTEQAHGVRLSAIVHDIGKIQVPAEVLNKPGNLTDLEFSLIKLHPQTGYDILKGIKFPWPIAQAVAQHHERCDGSGYPLGLKADQIIIEARIIAVADTVEAMSSHRPYRPGLGLEAALDEITKQSGTQLDPDAVSACIRLFKERGYQFP